MYKKMKKQNNKKKTKGIKMETKCVKNELSVHKSLHVQC